MIFRRNPDVNIPKVDKVAKDIVAENLVDVNESIDDLETELAKVKITAGRFDPEIFNTLAEKVDDIDKEVVELTGTTEGLDTRVEAIEEVIPSQASDTNQLADRDFVNSSIEHLAANYVTQTAAGTTQWTSLDALSAGPWFNKGVSYTPTLNDYAVFLYEGAVYRATFDGVQWNVSYKVNDTPFTADQLSALNSGITSTKVTTYDTHVASTANPHTVTATQVGLGNVPNEDWKVANLTVPANTGTNQTSDTTAQTATLPTLFNWLRQKVNGLIGGKAQTGTANATTGQAVSGITLNAAGVPTVTSIAIPAAANNGQLNIQVAGAAVTPTGGAFTANKSDASTYNIAGVNQSVNLASTTAANSITATSIGVTGTLPVGNGGTGNTTGAPAAHNQGIETINSGVATARILGRTSANSGAVEQLTTVPHTLGGTGRTTNFSANRIPLTGASAGGAMAEMAASTAANQCVLTATAGATPTWNNLIRQTTAANAASLSNTNQNILYWVP